MNSDTTITSDDTVPLPDTVGDPDDQADTRRLAAEADDHDPEEAGYGYGV